MDQRQRACRDRRLLDDCSIYVRSCWAMVTAIVVSVETMVMFIARRKRRNQCQLVRVTFAHRPYHRFM